MAKVTLNCGNISCAFRGEESFVLNAYQDFMSRFGNCADAAQAPTVGQELIEAPLPKAEDTAAAAQIPNAEVPQKEQAPAKMANGSASVSTLDALLENPELENLDGPALGLYKAIVRRAKDALAIGQVDETGRPYFTCTREEMQIDTNYSRHVLDRAVAELDPDGLGLIEVGRTRVGIGVPRTFFVNLGKKEPAISGDPYLQRLHDAIYGPAADSLSVKAKKLCKVLLGYAEKAEAAHQITEDGRIYFRVAHTDFAKELDCSKLLIPEIVKELEASNLDLFERVRKNRSLPTLFYINNNGIVA